MRRVWRMRLWVSLPNFALFSQCLAFTQWPPPQRQIPLRAIGVREAISGLSGWQQLSWSRHTAVQHCGILPTAESELEFKVKNSPWHSSEEHLAGGRCSSAQHRSDSEMEVQSESEFRPGILTAGALGTGGIGTAGVAGGVSDCCGNRQNWNQNRNHGAESKSYGGFLARTRSRDSRRGENVLRQSVKIRIEITTGILTADCLGTWRMGTVGAAGKV